MLECILTPGHTPGHMCMYEPEQKWFFSGDHVLFTITPNISWWDAFPDILSIYMDSLRRVRDLQVERLLPAHRGVRKNLEQRVDELLEHHSKRFEEICRILQKAGGQTAYEIAGQMLWKIRGRNWEEFPLEQKYFAVEEALAHLDYLEARSFIERQEQNGRKIYFRA